MLREYLTDKEWSSKPWAWRQGFLRYERDPLTCDNPHPFGSDKWNEWESGYAEAQFHAAVDGGYYDW